MDSEDGARVATWFAKQLGTALAVIGCCIAAGTGVALLVDSAVWIGAGVALGLFAAGINLRDVNAVRDVGSGRPIP